MLARKGERWAVGMGIPAGLCLGRGGVVAGGDGRRTGMMSCLYSTFCPRRIKAIVYFGEP
jgi:hypothetical protein